MTDQPTANMTKSASGTRAEVNATIQIDDTTEVRGTVRIAPAVLIQLIETTVLDIPGIVDLKRRKQDEPLPESGKAYDDGKVRVVVDGDQIEADISITVKHGMNVATLADTIQERVGVAAGRMLGMTVRTVNIYIDDIIAPPA